MDKGLKKKLITMLCVLSVFLSIPLSVCSLTYEEIYGELNTLEYQIDTETLSAFSNVHPKLLLNEERLSEIQDALANEDAMMHKAYYEVLKRARWGLENNPPETIVTASYDSFFSYLYEYAPSLALSYVLTKEEKYLEGAKKWMLAACDYPVWETKPDLATGIALTSLGLSYDWLYESLDAVSRDKVKAKMLEQANVVYENMRGVKTGYNRYWLQNHMWIPVSGMACAAAALYGEEDIAAGFLTLANNHFSTTMSLLPEDGFAHEGMDYFFYGMESLFIYADLSCALLGVDLFETDFFRNVSDYILYQFYPKSAWNTDCYYSNIGDSSGRGLKTHMIRLAAAKNRNGYAQWLANELDTNNVASGHPYFKMLWYDRSLLPTAPQKEKALLKHFTDMDVAVSKTGWEENDSMVIFKSGLPMGHKENELSKTMEDFYDFGGAHVHPDNNHFILYGNGELLLRDDNYTVPKFTLQHNTLTVNGEGQLGDSDRWFDTLEFHDGNGFAQIRKAETVSGIDHIVGEAAGSYRASAGLTKFDRHLIFLKPDILLVVDDIKLQSNKDLKLRFWPQSQEISETEDGFTVLGEKTKLKITDLTKNSDSKRSETETVWVKEATEERKSVSFSKNASEWVSAKAISWSDLSAEPVQVEYEDRGTEQLFWYDNRLLTLQLDTGSFTVQEYCDISVTLSGSGKITPYPSRILKDQQMEVSILPDPGWYIESVKVNGIPVIVDNTEEYQLSSIITQDSTVEVDFNEIKIPPAIQSVGRGFTWPGYGGILFAKISIPDSRMELIEYGFLFSENNQIPVEGDAGSVRLKALVPMNHRGQFGIQIKGKKICPGHTYFARCYLIYRDGEVDAMQYGEPFAFTPQSESVNAFLQSNGSEPIPYTSYELPEQTQEE